jgi:hypothetical protein
MWANVQAMGRAGCARARGGGRGTAGQALGRLSINARRRLSVCSGPAAGGAARAGLGVAVRADPRLSSDVVRLFDGQATAVGFGVSPYRRTNCLLCSHGTRLNAWDGVPLQVDCSS